MERTPLRKGEFNPTFVLPAIDLVMFVILMAVAGTFYFRTKGTEEIARVRTEVADARASNEDAVRLHEEAMAAAHRHNASLDSLRTERSQEIIRLGDEIQVETNKIAESKRIDQQLTGVVLDMRARIERADEQRRSYEATLLERDTEIAGLRAEVGALERSLADTIGVRRSLEDQIAALQRERARDPISMFPQRASFSSLVEAGGDQSYYSVALAGVLGQFNDVNYGLSGQVGLASEGSETVKEGGFFANIPLAFRRASLDLAGGIASITDPAGDEEVTPHVGATFRYAPLRKERFFLLAGTKYREDVSVQVGVGFGRR